MEICVHGFGKSGHGGGVHCDGETYVPRCWSCSLPQR